MKEVVQALIVAVLLIVTSLGLTLGEDRGWFADASERGFGVMIGILLAAMGNMMPKRAPTDGGVCEAERTFRMRSFAGWSFVIAGLGHAAIWTLAPLETANLLAMAVVATALVIVLARCFLFSRAA